MTGPAHLVALLLYGAGLRLLEGLMLRVKDVDFERGQIHVRDPKGRRDRHTMLPQMAVPLLRRQLERSRAVHDDDLRDGFGVVWIPEAIERKIPTAPKGVGMAVDLSCECALQGAGRNGAPPSPARERPAAGSEECSDRGWSRQA